MHKTPYPLLRVVRVGTRCSSPSSACSVWKRSSSCRHLNNTHVCPGRRGRGHFSRCSETWWSETPTAQYIIYNIKKGCSETRVVLRKMTQQSVSWSFLFPSPAPPRKKLSTTYPKTTPHQDLLITSVWPRDRLPGQLPSTNQLRGPHRGFVSGRISDHVLASSRPRLTYPDVVRMWRQFPGCPASGGGIKWVFCSSGKQHDDLKEKTMDKTLQNTLKESINTMLSTCDDKGVFTDDGDTYRKHK